MDTTHLSVKSKVWIVVKNFLLLLVPFVGGIIVLYNTVKALTIKTYPIYGIVPIYKRDRRFKTGYRQIGSAKKVIGRKPLTDIEIATHREEGRLLLWFWLGVFVVGFLVWLIRDIIRLSKYE